MENLDQKQKYQLEGPIMQLKLYNESIHIIHMNQLGVIYAWL